MRAQRRVEPYQLAAESYLWIMFGFLSFLVIRHSRSIFLFAYIHLIATQTADLALQDQRRLRFDQGHRRRAGLSLGSAP